MFKNIFYFLFNPTKVSEEFISKEKGYKNKIFYLIVVCQAFILSLFSGIGSSLPEDTNLTILKFVFTFVPAFVFTFVLFFLIFVLTTIIFTELLTIVMWGIGKIFKGTAKYIDVLLVVAMSQIPGIIYFGLSSLVIIINIDFYFIGFPWLLYIFIFIFTCWTIYIFSKGFAKVEGFSFIKTIIPIGIVILPITGLIGIILLVQYFFFSYSEKDFNIPDNYFDRMYEHENILSAENGTSDFFRYLWNSPESIVIGNETEEEFYEKYKKMVSGERYDLDYYYSEKYLCEIMKVERNCKEYNSYIKRQTNLEELEYGGKIFNDFLVYIEEKLSLYENLKDKRYIKFDFSPSVQGYSTKARAISQIVIMHFENGDYNKGMDLITKYVESIDDVTNKLFFNDALLPVVLFVILKVNHDTIEYIISNYQDIPEDKLMVLLSQLEKPGRELMYVDMVKSEFWRCYNAIKRDNFLKEVSKEYEDKSYITKIFDLFYSEEETKALLKKLTYDFINKGGKESDLKITNNFHYKNLNNFLGRVLIGVSNKVIQDLGSYSNSYKENKEKRKELIRQIKDIIDSKNNMKDSIIKAIQNK